MGQHKGWRVCQDTRRNNWRGEVRHNGSYIVRCFPTAKEARTWASDQAAQIRMAKGYTPLRAGVLTEIVAADYQADLTARNRAPSYLRDVAVILAGAIDACPTLDAADAPRQITSWINADARLSPARRNKYRQVIRSLCRWAIRHDRLAVDPTRAILPAAVPERLKPQLTLDEMRRLVRYQAQPPGWRWAMLMLYAGLRADEARCLRYADIDLAGRVITISADSGARLKRGRERLVPLQPELLPMLMPMGPPALAIAGLGRNNLQRTFRDLLADAGIEPGNRSPHSMRHTFAGLMTATGVPAAMVGAYLGHTQASTTMIYTKLAVRYAAGVTAWGRGEIRLAE
ncbi:MAG: tyrosine recombinase XerD [Pseudomonadota bacterium]|jgi:integrase/recombinase XerC